MAWVFSKEFFNMIENRDCMKGKNDQNKNIKKFYLVWKKNEKASCKSHI